MGSCCSKKEGETTSNGHNNGMHAHTGKLYFGLKVDILAEIIKANPKNKNRAKIERSDDADPYW